MKYKSRVMHRNQPYYVKQSGSMSQKRINTMVYYLFPKCSFDISGTCHVSHNPETFKVISPSQFHYMNEIKKRIQECGSWKKISANSFSNIHEISKITNVTNLVFYEILEVYSIMHFSWKNFYKLNTLHFGNDAEMTLKSFQYIRNFAKQDSNVIVSADILRKHQPNKKIDVAFCHASDDDDEQTNGTNILKQVLVVLASQKQKGACIIKIGDTFTSLSLDIISLLSHFYEKTYVMKPLICDLTKCDKYIICKNFLYETLPDNVLDDIHTLHTEVIQAKSNIYRVLQNKMPLFFSGKLEEINSIFGQPRLEYIHQLLSQSEKNDLKSNKQKCIEWCAKYMM